jgi:predicted phage terminase large subunit-like protein
LREAAQELLTRRSIRNNLTDWCQLNGFKPAHHHRLLLEKLERVATGDCRRLAVFMPPGSAKSSYCSVLFPPWFFGQHPEANVIAASHTIELAQRFGRRVRNLMQEHGPILGVNLSDDNHAAGRWSTTVGGEYYSAGVGVGIAGFRADLAIIDDPIKSRQDADSETVREHIWDWFKSDLSTRLKPGGRIILIQTRWHEDDLAGRILAEMEAGGQEWEVLSLPAEAIENDPLGRKPGEMLWDDAYGYGRFLRSEKATQTPRNWSALYQQAPAPESGNFFKDEWLRTYITPPDPKTLSIYGASDYAVTENGGDYTVHVVVGVDPKGNIYLLDLWRGQTSSDVWVSTWCDLVKRWKPLDWAEEKGQIAAGLGPFRDAEASRQKAYVNVEMFPTRGSKAVRAQSIRGRMAMGFLYVPASAPWFADFRAELLMFPAGKHDDQVDALGLVGQLLDRMIPGRIPAKDEAVKQTASGYRPADAAGIDDWKIY